MEYLYMFILSVLLTVVLVIITIIDGKMIKADKSNLSSIMLGTVFPNSGNYGAPVALFAYGTGAFDYALIIMVIRGLIHNPRGIFIAACRSERSAAINAAPMNP